MRKTPQDRREDFDDVYDFDQAFCQQFRIVLPERMKEIRMRIRIAANVAEF